jgi:hypothetical protein
MMQDLITTVQQLKTDQYAAITVLNQNNPLQTIVKDATGAALENQFNSVENFFETQFKNGTTELIIVPRRKNGSSFKTAGNSFSISMKPKQSQQQSAPEPMAPFGVGLMGGLNQMDLSYKFMDHPRLVQLVATLEAENKLLKETNDQLKEKDIRNEFQSQSKAANNELIKTFAPLLAPIISKLAASPEAPGLNAANFRPTQQQFLNLIQASDDATLQYLSNVLRGFSTEAFLNDLDNLLKIHNITE